MNSVEQYDKQGYIVLRNLFNNKEISLLDFHVDRIYQQWTNENEAEIFNKKLVNMHSLTSPEYFENRPKERIQFFEAITSMKLTKVIEDLFGSAIYFHNTQLFFNPTNKEKLPYWHRDLQYSPFDDEFQREEQANMLSLHVRIPLIKEKGVEIVTGTHKRWDTELERNVRLELNGHKNSESLPNTKLIDLTPGDVLIFDAQMIHRGNYELNSTRKALDLCIGKYHPTTGAYLDEAVQPKKDELNKIANNHWYTLASDIAASK